MSWLFSQVLVAEYLGENYLDGEQSVPLSGSNTQQAYCAPDKMTDFYRVSQFGMTFKPLTENLGEELLTLYLEDFHAKTLVQQEKGGASKPKEAECGKRWRESLAKLDQDTLLWKIPQCSLLEDLEQSLEIWPRWGSMRNGECFPQPMLGRITNENEFGYVPNNKTFFHTPCTTEMDGGSNSRKALKKRIKFPTPIASDCMNRNSLAELKRKTITLATMAAHNVWPTPDANCGQRGTQPNWTAKRKSGHPAQYTINQAVRDSYATPTARMWKDNGTSPSELNRNSETLAVQAGGKLNPMWVEWLMGWSLGWTDLKPLEMDKSHFVQQQPLNCSEKD